MKVSRLLLCVAALASALFTFTPNSIAQTPGSYTEKDIEKAESAFEEGNSLIEQKKFREALESYRRGLSAIPDSAGLLYNAGLAAFTIREFSSAQEMWDRLKKLEPDDWQVRAKLIQTYQALNQTAKRDSEREELFSLRRSGKVEELKEAEFYVREQTEAAGKAVMVFEHFELVGDRALKYVFYVLDDEGEPEFRISLGSYESTNRIWRELEKRAPGERLFHLDGYFPNGSHATYGMYSKEPTYDETRRIVFQILEKEKKPISSTTVVNPSPEPSKKP